MADLASVERCWPCVCSVCVGAEADVYSGLCESEVCVAVASLGSVLVTGLTIGIPADSCHWCLVLEGVDTGWSVVSCCVAWVPRLLCVWCGRTWD